MSQFCRHLPWLASLALAVLCPLDVVRAQTALDWSRQPQRLAPLDQIDPASPSYAPPLNYRAHLLGMVPGFLNDPVGLEIEDLDPTSPGLPPALPDGERGPDWITLALGMDNPYFEVRRRGDPGGVGYYRLASQVQLLQSPKTAFGLGLQAFTPAGLSSYLGAIDGPTVISPAMFFYHQLNDGSALQAFLGKNMPFASRIGGQIRQRLQYGVAYQKPLWAQDDGSPGSLYFCIEALGRFRYYGGNATTASATLLPSGPLPPGNHSAVWEMLPGLQWRLTDAFWLSSGFAMPLGPVRPDGHQLHITCSFQF